LFEKGKNGASKRGGRTGSEGGNKMTDCVENVDFIIGRRRRGRGRGRGGHEEGIEM
jgi:hypothetical protein